MMIAQQLYEGNTANIPNHTGGLITYMRTDSLNLSTVATTAAKKLLKKSMVKIMLFQNQELSNQQQKVHKRHMKQFVPVDMSLKPSMVKDYLEPSQYRLYSLIWKRTIATQMAQAKIANTTYKIEAGKNKEFEFQTTGQKNYFAGFDESLYRR